MGGCDSYELKALKDIIGRGFQETNFQIRKAKVLIKPNLLAGRSPDSAVTTHPLFVRAIAEVLLDSTCEVYIGDSPGYEPIEKVMKNCELSDVIEDLGLNIAYFRSKIIKKHNGISPYNAFTFGEDPENYDAIINVPKLKTHGMMGITLGVKNTFGFIHAFEKARWHLRAGADRSLFAALLIDIHNIVKPALTIVDGVRGMDGAGPSHGRPREFKLVAFSRNAYVLDRAIEKALGLSSPLPVSSAAKEFGLMKSFQTIDMGAPHVDDFRLPESMTATDWNLPPVVRRVLKAVFVKKPRLDQSKCLNCGVCISVCPAKALALSKKGPKFDYGKCIRCYCCQEMCPQGAVVV